MSRTTCDRGVYAQGTPTQPVQIEPIGQWEEVINIGSPKIPLLLVGDLPDWQAFFKNNEPRIQPLGGIFKWSQPFRRDNPIHDLLSIESKIATPAEVEAAYKTVNQILQLTRQHLKQSPLTPQQKLRLVYTLIRSIGMEFKDSGQHLFTQDVKKKELDCDTSSFIVLAVAHEMGWPVHLVRAPGHIFVRWDDDKGTRFNIDFGKITSDDDYYREFSLSPQAVGQGVYLKNLSQQRLHSVFLVNRGNAKAALGNRRGAIDDYTAALKLNPKDAAAYINRGIAKTALGDYQGAIEDCTAALKFDPNLADAYNNRGFVKTALGDHRGAIEEYTAALKFNPKFADAYYNRGLAKAYLGDYRGAIVDFTAALKFNPNLANAHNNRGLAKAYLKDYRGAIMDFTAAIKLNPKFADAYYNRGVAKERLGDLLEAANDFTVAKKLDPKKYGPSYSNPKGVK
jgi:tetratricopeptide (TPR) repeat protein